MRVRARVESAEPPLGAAGVHPEVASVSLERPYRVRFDESTPAGTVRNWKVSPAQAWLTSMRASRGSVAVDPGALNRVNRPSV